MQNIKNFSNENLIAEIINRLNNLNDSEEKEIIINKLEESLFWLHRLKDRVGDE